MHCFPPPLKYRYVLRNLIHKQERNGGKQGPPILLRLFLIALRLVAGWPGSLGAPSMEMVSRLLQILTGHEA